VDPRAAADRAAPLTADRLLDLLYRRDVALARHRGGVARSLGVSPTELLALVHLARPGELTPAALADLLDLSPGGASALVQRLAAAGHVTRRGARVRVAPGTARALRAAEAPWRAATDAVLRGLSGEQRASVETCLSALADRGERLAGRAGAGPPADGAGSPFRGPGD
jgi:DNA-binding MarR family transcriptional regulator